MSDASFPPTQWTLLVSAKEAAETLVLRQAREQLCLRYWRPLYVYARARGQNVEDAEDLVQGFLIRMMEGDRFLAADQSRGRFRSYLLTAFQRFMTEEWRREGAQKRGGGEVVVSIHFEDIEEKVKQLPAEESPELVFDRAWAKTIVADSMAALKEKWAGDRAPVFEALKPHIALSSAESLVADLGAAGAEGEHAADELEAPPRGLPAADPGACRGDAAAGLGPRRGVAVFDWVVGAVAPQSSRQECLHHAVISQQHCSKPFHTRGFDDPIWLVGAEAELMARQSGEASVHAQCCGLSGPPVERALIELRFDAGGHGADAHNEIELVCRGVLHLKAPHGVRLLVVALAIHIVEA